MRRLIRERGLENYSFARIANYPADPTLNGLTIPEVAQKLKGGRDLDSQFETMRLMLRAGGASMVYQFMAEEDITRILRHPQVAIASDSGLNVDRPRRAPPARLRQHGRARSAATSASSTSCRSRRQSAR